MNYSLFLLALLLLIILLLALRHNDQSTKWIWTALVFACFVSTAIPQSDVLVVSWPVYPGFVKGIQIQAIDIVVLILFFRMRNNRSSLPFRITMTVYFLCIFLSSFFALLPMASIFYLWQLLRMYLVFHVVAHACSDQRVVPAILNGFALGLALEASVSLYQRYGEGLFQVTGTFGHQNILGFAANLCAIPIFALVLSQPRSWLLASAPVSASIIAVLTASRATIILLGLGYLLTFFYSLISEPTGRKVKIALIGASLMLVIGPIGWSSLQQRYELLADSSGYDERAAYNKAALMMVVDHPFGVGANNFVVVANGGGYYERAGVANGENNRKANVHSFYWLTLAEAGYIGLVALIPLLMQPLITAWRLSWKFRKRSEGAVFSGCMITLLVCYVHSTVEFELAYAQIQFFLMIIFGIVAGYSLQVRDERQLRMPVDMTPSTKFTVMRLKDRAEYPIRLQLWKSGNLKIRKAGTAVADITFT